MIFPLLFSLGKQKKKFVSILCERIRADCLNKLHQLSDYGLRLFCLFVSKSPNGFLGFENFALR